MELQLQLQAPAPAPKDWKLEAKDCKVSETIENGTWQMKDEGWRMKDVDGE